MEMPEKMTIGEAYGPAMEIQTQAEADEYFEALVKFSMKKFNNSRIEAEANERANLGYYAGHCDAETRSRVQELFKWGRPKEMSK